MSKPLDRKPTNPPDSSPGAQTNLVRTTFSYVAPLEVSENKEASVTIWIKEIRYGGKTLPNTDAVAVINGLKKTWPVPMEEPFTQEFAKVSDDMIFKFAVTSNNDLLGFLYLEIPKKFRAMRTLTMDDWFPIKRLETEDKAKEMFQNYQAKILIEYEASRRLEPGKTVTNRAPKAELYQEIASSLKEKLDKIHRRVDEYEKDGFRFLDEYQAKLSSVKATGATAALEPKKGVKVAAAPNKTLGAQKDAMYRTRGPNDAEDKAALYSSLPMEKTLQMTKGVKKAEGDEEGECPHCEKLYKELSYSNQELIQANSRVSNLEKAKMTPENQALKREVETLQQQLSKDRKELNVRLKEANANLQAETVKLSKRYDSENDAAKSLQAEARALQQELADRLKAVEGREKEVVKRREGLARKDAQIAERQRKTKAEFDAVQKEHQQIAEEMRDMTELKQRMMIERQKVWEEQSKLQNSKSDNEEKNGTIQTIEEFLEEEKEQFKKELAKKNMELEQLKADAEKQKRLNELEVRTLADNKLDFERRLKEHNDALAAHKIEVARMARERNNHANSMADFLEQRKAYEQEKEMADEEIARNYDLLDEQTQQLNDQKAEYNNLLRRLNEFEQSINEQGKTQQEQKAKFLQIQKSFFAKVAQPGYDFKDLKKLAEEVGVSMNDADERFKNAQKIEKEMSRVRVESRQSIEQMSQRLSRDDIRVDKKSEEKGAGRDRRLTTRLKDTMSFIGGGQTDNKMKLQQNASQIVDKIFSDASLHVYKKHNVNKQEVVDGLRFKIETLQEEIRRLTEKSQGAKINFLSENAEEDFLVKSLRPKDGGDSPAGLRQLIAEENSPEELMETLGDLCEATLQHIEQDAHVGVAVPHAREKREYLASARRVLTEQLKVMQQLASAAGKGGAEGAAFDWEKDQLDHERMRAQFDAKMKQLLDYIHSLKINNDFFNPGIDAAILSN